MLECIIQPQLQDGFGPIVFIAVCIWSLAKKKDWGHVPMEQNKKYITSGLAFEFTFRKQRGPNAIKGAYFESIFSFLWFDQKAKYLVPIFQLSN
jgi:hypothetical protein